MPPFNRPTAMPLPSLLLSAPLLLLAPDSTVASSAWLGLLPDGETKRRFVLDCTGCHVFDETRALVQGRPRTRDEWAAAISRMLEYAGPTSSFPVISRAAKPAELAAWLAGSLGNRRPAAKADSAGVEGAVVTEYDLPEAQDLPHDVAVDSAGSGVLITGMFTHVIYRLDLPTGKMTPVPIPVPKANPRAIELDRAGDWWILLGNPKLVAHRNRRTGAWRTFPIGAYPHSIALTEGGAVWFNAHFSQAPELLGSLDSRTGRATTHAVPPHPTLATGDGGPVPYELRVAPDGTIWMSELQGNRMIAYRPGSDRFDTFTLPTPWSGPRRFDIDARGRLWIPAYSANALLQLDPATGRFTEHRLPDGDAVPYVARVDHANGMVWIGTSAADAVYRFDPRTARFTRFPLPTRGAIVRHITIDPATHDVWLAYGASPAKHPARIARLRPPR